MRGNKEKNTIYYYAHFSQYHQLLIAYILQSLCHFGSILVNNFLFLLIDLEKLVKHVHYF